MRLRLLEGCLCFLLCLSCLTARGHYHRKQIGIEDGLSQPSITAMTSDPHGNIWIGTRFGINRYRNGRVKRYIDNNEPGRSLKGNQVEFLFLDSQEKLWASTDLGLSFYSQEEDAFLPVRSEDVLCALEEADVLYFGGYEGLLIYDRASGHFDRDLPPRDIPVIVNMYPLRDGKLLLVSRTNGLYIFDTGSRSWENIPLESQGQMVLGSIFCDGVLYLSCYRQGVSKVNPLTGEVLARWNAAGSGLTFDIVLSMARYRDQILLGTDGGGICALNLSDGRICTLGELLGLSDHFFPTNSFTCLYVGKDESIWAGSVRHGLFYLRESSICTFSKEDGLSENIINDLCPGADGRLWLATDGGGLNVYDPASGVIGPAKGFSDEIVSSVCRFSRERLLLSEFSGGLYLYDPATGRKTRFCIVDPGTDRREIIHSGYTPKLARSGDYIFILGSSPYCYDLQSGQFYCFPHQEELAGLQGFWSDGDGTILAFSYREIFRLNARRHTVETLYRVRDSHFIHAAARSGNLIWMGTDYGIKYIQDGSDTATVIESKMFNRVTRLQASSDALLWITADHGLFYYDMAHGRLEMVDESEGFAPHEILCSASSARGNYPIYFGGLNGLVKLDGPQRSHAVSFLVPEFYEASMDGKRVVAGGDAITLPRDYKNFDITINVRGADAFSRRPIRYTLTGNGTRVSTSYEDTYPVGLLSPGRYRLRASCLGPDGQWGPESDILSFRVQEPWYRSWWFLFSVLVVLLGLLGLLWQYLAVRQRERYAQDRIRFLTQISHELRTPLTLIYAPVKRLLSSSGDETVRSSLDGVFRNIEKMKSITDVVLDREKSFVAPNLSQAFPAWSKALEESASISLPRTGMPETHLSEYRILCVEDNPELRQLLVTELTPFCKEVRTACDGQQGLEEIRSYMPDVVVSDVMMPRMDGFELCRQVKSDLSISHIPLVLLTARADAASILTGYKAGADSYLAKPFDTALLLQVIENLLSSREKMRRRFLSPQEQAPSPEETTYTKADEAFLEHLNKFIEEHLDVPELDVNAIASEMAVSRASLYNKVKAITGLGVAQYVESIKMRKACALLTDTQMGISEIADTLGFGSSRYFSSRFKQVTGLNPLSYRNRKNGNQK